MKTFAMSQRYLIAMCVLAGGITLLYGAGRQQSVPLSQPLEQFPQTLGPWNGMDQPLEASIVKAVGVDHYLNRLYKDGQGNMTQLYIGYYRRQKTGESIHSPKNCLPGGGWTPVRSGQLTVAVAGRPSLVVNEFIIENGLEKDLVLYWYQSQGRSVASEYWAKFWMVTDALRRNRTDGALVRVWTPVVDGEENARLRAISL